MKHFLVESSAGVTAALGSAAEHECVFYTSNPYVVESLASQRHTVIWADRIIGAETPNRIGLAANDMLDSLRPEIESVSEAIGFPELAAFMCRRLRNSITSLIFKQVVLEACIAEAGGDLTVVGTRSGRPIVSDNISLDMYDTLLFALAEHSRVEGVTLLEEPDVDRATLLADIDRPIALDRLLSLLNFDIAQLVWRWLKYLGKGRPLALRQPRFDVLILKENEAIREYLPHLLWKGARVRMIDLPAARGLPENNDMRIDIRLEEHMQKAVDSHGLGTKAGMIAKLIEGPLAASFRRAPAARERAIDFVSSLTPMKGHAVVATNSPGSIEHVALISALREGGIRCAVVEHGVSAGLSRLHEGTRPYSEAANGDAYLSASPEAVHFFGSDPTYNSRTLIAAGMPKITRKVPLKSLQYLIVRQRLKAKPGERVVMYLARSVQNNLRNLPYSPEDHEVHALQHKMLHDVLPNVAGIPVAKLYATRRYRDPDPYLDLVRPPEHVRVLKHGDFRYLRAGVDIIILETPLSTLGWAFGSGKPIIYLKQSCLPLQERFMNLLEKSVFIIDTDKKDWTAELIHLANRDYGELTAAWNSMAEFREELLSSMIFGPENCGANGASALEGLAFGSANRFAA